MMIHRLICLGALVLAVGLNLGCNPSKPNARQQLVLGLAGDPKTFNLAIADDVSSMELLGYMMEGLIGYDNSTQQHVHRITTDWSYNEETREWTFKLRPDLKWSDGVPITSSDLMFFVEVVRDENVPSTEKEFLKGSDGTPYEFSAPDPLTFVAKIPEVNSFAFLNLGLIRPMPRHKMEESLKAGTLQETYGINEDPANMAFSGPFVLKEVMPGQRIVLGRNPYYFMKDDEGNPLPRLDEVVFVVVEDMQALSIRFQNGDIDMLTSIQPDMLPTMMDKQEDLGITLYNPGTSLSVNHYWFNLHPGGSYDDGEGGRAKWEPQAPGEKPDAKILQANFKPYISPVKRAWFENQEFRQACSMLTNREEMVRVILFGEGEPLYGMVPPSNTAWHSDNIPKFPYNPAKAKEVLDSIGFVDSDGDGIREDADGNPLRFTIITNKENQVREKVGTMLKEDLRKGGLDVTMQVLDFNDILTRLTDSYDYDACILGLGSGVPPHPSMSRSVVLSSGRMHHYYPLQPQPMSEGDAKMDALYAQMEKEFDQEKQFALYEQIQQIAAEEQKTIHLFCSNLYLAASNRIGNLEPSVLRPELTHNIDELYIKN